MSVCVCVCVCVCAAGNFTAVLTRSRRFTVRNIIHYI